MMSIRRTIRVLPGLLLAFACTTAGTDDAAGGSSATGSDDRDCPERVTEDDCLAANDDGGVRSCGWYASYPVQLTAEGCSFGDAVGRCVALVQQNDGCTPDPWGCDMGGPAVFHATTAEGVSLLEIPNFSCLFESSVDLELCPFGAEGSTTGDDESVMPPECYCACDPGLPG